ncbi:MAG: hypothetical protein RSG52_13200 [Terrisporobacter sp.]|uniref:hypothetical protein n=1 Tax=Terrisporobacter sp. TaxID=1965305 RepID=UPI002FC6793A
MKLSKNLFVKLLISLFMIIGLCSTNVFATTNETIKAIQSNFIFLFVFAILAAIILGSIIAIIETLIKKNK